MEAQQLLEFAKLSFVGHEMSLINKSSTARTVSVIQEPFRVLETLSGTLDAYLQSDQGVILDKTLDAGNLNALEV